MLNEKIGSETQELLFKELPDDPAAALAQVQSNRAWIQSLIWVRDAPEGMVENSKAIIQSLEGKPNE